MKKLIKNVQRTCLYQLKEPVHYYKYEYKFVVEPFSGFFIVELVYDSFFQTLKCSFAYKINLPCWNIHFCKIKWIENDS